MRLVALYPELYRNEMSILDDQQDCILQLFAGPPHVVAFTNATAFPVSAMVELVVGERLFDRSSGTELSSDGLNLTLQLEPWQSAAFELKLGGHLCAEPLQIVQILENKGSEQV
ncbi:MAG TPA: hypothetical protein VN673_02440 [Clostridia bacterium]|nr:hypothetical protein [Clostridia bacterium]